MALCGQRQHLLTLIVPNTVCFTAALHELWPKNGLEPGEKNRDAHDGKDTSGCDSQ